MVYNIAILGYGVVGSGVVEILEKNKRLIDKRALKDINVKYILDKRDFPDSSVSDILVKDIDIILNDENVDTVVEVMGGTKPAYDFVKAALLKGKSVVTSNKELVADYGTELMKIAYEKDINFLFEASAGGGIPVIRSIKQALTADEINKIEGILNGTTNYILSKMESEGADYSDALSEAQKNGYAEKDPTNDVEGFDSVRKLAILLSLSTRKSADYKKIPTEGITNISYEDISFANALNGKIKLIATAEKGEDGFFAEVCPVIVGKEHKLRNVNDVFNGVLITGNAVDEITICGKGAGKMPTASAVMGDVVDIARHTGNMGYYWSEKPLKILSYANTKKNYFVKINCGDSEKTKADIKKIFDTDEFIVLDKYPDTIAFVVENDTKASTLKKLEGLSADCKIKILKMED